MTSPVPDASPAALTHVDALAVGERLAEFEITGLLGVGGFGLVYQAFDHSLHRPVAIKEYMPSALAGRAEGQRVATRSSADGPAYESGLRGFLSEARLLARFDHPSLVKVFRFWEANGTAYMVMPLYQGMTLKQARQQMRSPPPEAWLRQVLGGVLGALSVLHEGDTLHRDVSPDNLFLQDLGPPVLLDLGAARRAVGEQTQKHTAILKVNYAPIEQYAEAEDMHPGPWSDLYSLAAVVYDCLCNKPAPPATFRIIKDRMLPLAEVARVVEAEFGQSYSAPFVASLSQALAIRPEQRPASTQALAEAMGLSVDLARLSRFDWRAELGDLWQAPGSAPPPQPGSTDVTTVLPGPAPSPTTPEPDLDFTWPQALSVDARPPAAVSATRVEAPSTAARTVPLAAAEVAAPAAVPPVVPRAAGAPPSADALHWRQTVIGVVLLSLLGAGLGWWWQVSHDPDAGVITELAEPAAPAASAGAAAASPPAPGPAQPTEGQAGAGAPTAAPTSAPVAESPRAGSSPAARSTAVTPGGASDSSQRKAAAAAVPPAATGAAATGAASRGAASGSAAGARTAGRDEGRGAEAASNRPGPEPVAPAGGAASGSGAALCADSHVLAKTMCMHQACARPENTATKACVDYRRGLQERSERLF
ncbi:serine/threonine-protein kinase [Curvibacter sp. HBC61]|uniref:non-specific serine/threonine protein kinase n=1 Tax=Curvibacter cyanobacteriorum TaxID=3026422 RepID=A0ABT5N3T2_9BURK|nr:serine/threonine-protein kinase [Curvibacter sp. HBC61]MDD0840979.1 serine/threonine-protein kinase [Curvibacter sp. HBC61]